MGSVRLRGDQLKVIRSFKGGVAMTVNNCVMRYERGDYKSVIQNQGFNKNGKIVLHFIKEIENPEKTEIIPVREDYSRYAAESIRAIIDAFIDSIPAVRARYQKQLKESQTAIDGLFAIKQIKYEQFIKSEQEKLLHAN